VLYEAVISCTGIRGAVRLEQLQPERCRACPTCEWVDGFAVIVDLANGGAILDTQYLGNSSVLDIVLNYPGPFNSLRTLYDTIDIGNMGMTTLCGETTYFAYDRDGIVVGAASQFDPNLLTSLVSGAPGLVAYRNRQDDFTFDTANFSPTNYVTQFQIEMVDLKSGEVMATRIFDTAVVVTRSGTYRLLVRSSFVSLSTSLACSQQQHQHQERLNTQVETATKKKNERRRNDTTVRCVLWLVSNDIFVGAGESSISITIF
jgi:hypothetical protein